MDDMIVEPMNVLREFVLCCILCCRLNVVDPAR